MIVDTSVLFDAVVDGPRSHTARTAMAEAETLLAPDLIRIELANALTRSVRRNAVTSEFARAAYDFAEGLVPIEPSVPEVSRALELSLELVHPCADCLFLAFSERRGARLATSDAQFARKLAGTGYARLIHLIEA